MMIYAMLVLVNLKKVVMLEWWQSTRRHSDIESHAGEPRLNSSKCR